MTELARRHVVPMQTRIQQSSLDDAFVAMTDEQERTMTTTVTPVPESALARARADHRPRAFARLLRTELRLFVREPVALFWGVLFPLVLLIVLGIATSSKPQHRLGDVKFIVAYTPVVMVFTLTILALNALPTVLASYREKGYLRRLSTTPVGVWRLLTAELAMNFAVERRRRRADRGDRAGRVRRAAARPGDGGFVLAMVLGAAAMLGLGHADLGDRAVAADSGAGRLAVVLPDDVLRRAMGAARGDGVGAAPRFSDFTPLGALVAAVQQTTAGHWPGAGHLLVLAAWALILCVAAGRLFRWES